LRVLFGCQLPHGISLSHATYRQGQIGTLALLMLQRARKDGLGKLWCTCVSNISLTFCMPMHSSATPASKRSNSESVPLPLSAIAHLTCPATKCARLMHRLRRAYALWQNRRCAAGVTRVPRHLQHSAQMMRRPRELWTQPATLSSIYNTITPGHLARVCRPPLGSARPCFCDCVSRLHCWS